MNLKIKKIANRKFKDIQSINLFQFRRSLRMLIYILEIKGDFNKIANVVRVFVQKKNRLERTILIAFKSFLSTSKIKLSKKVKNQGESTIEFENLNIAINLDDNANSYELK